MRGEPTKGIGDLSVTASYKSQMPRFDLSWLLARGSGLKVFHSRWCATRMNIFHRTRSSGSDQWVNQVSWFYLKSPKNTPSIAVGLDGDEFGIVGA
jgi:hypothetical protein